MAGVPLLNAENRQRFALEAMANLHSMAPYWRHRTMSCADVGNHVRALDRRLMSNGVALNGVLFYRGMLGYEPAQRAGAAGIPTRIAGRHPLVLRRLRLSSIAGWTPACAGTWPATSPRPGAPS